MPITGNASYIPTINEFYAHWSQVDAALPAPLVVARMDGSSMDRVAFNNTRIALEGLYAGVMAARNVQEVARRDVDLLKVRLHGWLHEFTGLMDAYLRTTHYYDARPKMPGIGEGQQNFLDPMNDMASLWVMINAGVAPVGINLPMTLSDGTAVAAFTAAVAELNQFYLAEKAAAQGVVLARANRDAMKAVMYETMKGYREAVPPRCRLFPVLVDTMPRLSPAPGHTPDPVNASAVFEAPDKARVVYDASVDADLAAYQLRGNPGGEYDEEDAVVVESHGPGDPRVFLTTFGLTQPNTRAAFKVFVVLGTGNEAGGAELVVHRPPV